MELGNELAMAVSAVMPCAACRLIAVSKRGRLPKAPACSRRRSIARRLRRHDWSISSLFRFIVVPAAASDSGRSFVQRLVPLQAQALSGRGACAWSLVPITELCHKQSRYARFPLGCTEGTPYT